MFAKTNKQQPNYSQLTIYLRKINKLHKFCYSILNIELKSFRRKQFSFYLVMRIFYLLNASKILITVYTYVYKITIFFSI